MIFGASLSYILIDVGLALIALVVGFGAALVYVRHSANYLAGEEETDQADDAQQAAANDVERASMAVDQVRDLTISVASDVGEHNEMVTTFSEELGAVDADNANSGTSVADAIAKMLDANDRLLTRLDEAEDKIKAQAEEIRTQQSEARTDALTNLANRRAFDDAINACLARYQVDRQPFSMLLLDVDHFKNFNDTHGHQAGDEVLRSVGRTLQRVVKKTDTPCRYGGEEFAVVMPNTNVAQGRIAAERVRKSIEALAVDFEGQSMNVTASVGVAEIVGAEQAAQLIRRADDAVYAAKKSGTKQLPLARWSGVSAAPPGKPSSRGVAAAKESQRFDRPAGARCPVAQPRRIPRRVVAARGRKPSLWSLAVGHELARH